MRYIEYLVKRKYKSLSDFATACDIPKCTMHHYFSGTRFPNTHNFMTIATNLDVTAEHLYENWYREI